MVPQMTVTQIDGQALQLDAKHIDVLPFLQGETGLLSHQNSDRLIYPLYSTVKVEDPS